jgi:hypothetical protein
LKLLFRGSTATEIVTAKKVKLVGPLGKTIGKVSNTQHPFAAFATASFLSVFIADAGMLGIFLSPTYCCR